MKRCRAKLIVVAIFLGAITAANAQAGGGGHFHGHGGGHWRGHPGGVPFAPFIAPLDPRAMFGAMLLAPLLYPPPPPPVYAPPVYYAPPARVVVAEPPYAVALPTPPPPPETGYWYHRYWRFYCASAKAYYPSVAICPEGWQQVAPQPSY